jgi:hypothetical protein
VVVLLGVQVGVNDPVAELDAVCVLVAVEDEEPVLEVVLEGVAVEEAVLDAEVDRLPV